MLLQIPRRDGDLALKRKKDADGLLWQPASFSVGLFCFLSLDQFSKLAAEDFADLVQVVQPDPVDELVV